MFVTCMYQIIINLPFKIMKIVFKIMKCFFKIMACVFKMMNIHSYGHVFDGHVRLHKVAPAPKSAMFNT